MIFLMQRRQALPRFLGVFVASLRLCVRSLCDPTLHDTVRFDAKPCDFT